MPKVVAEKFIKSFGLGTIDNIKPEAVPRGAASDSFNFITHKDRIEIAGGRRIIGAEEESNTPVLGLYVITKPNGEEVAVRKIVDKVQYYDKATDEWVDAKTGLLTGERVFFDESSTPAGKQLWMGGKDGLFKMYPSNPDSFIDLTHSTKNYKGNIFIKKSRMITVGMEEDPTGMRFSKVDKDSNYTTITAEAITDTATGKKHYTGTLAHTQGFGYVFKDGSAQTLTDDKNGNLIGDGTGTINYATGAYVLDFTNNTATPVVCDYIYEDPLTNGLADFGYSASRLAGEGNIQRQDSTGSISRLVIEFNNVYYTLQNKGVWAVSIDSTDLKWDNDIFRSTIGVPSNYGGVATADGVVLVDTIEPEDPKLRLLSYDRFNERIIPYDLSHNKKCDFKMDKYTFDTDTVVFRFYQYILIACKKNSEKNNVIILYNMLNQTFDELNYSASCFAVYGGKIIAGDSFSANTYEILTGYDDIDYTVQAYWKSGSDDLDTNQLKKFKQLKINGLIDKEQKFNVFAMYDNETPEFIGTVYGTGDYVDSESNNLIGTETLGEDVIGLGDSSNALYFETGIKVRTPKFKRVQILCEPIGIGYLAIWGYGFSDIRTKGNKLPKKFKSIPRTGIGSDQISESFIVR